MKVDGLNSLNYKLNYYVMFENYTHVYVDLLQKSSKV